MDDVVDLRIEKIAALGEGLASLGGKKVFVPFTLHGELVKAKVVKRHKDYDRALPVEILEASKDRVTPPCPLFMRCGGCTLQHMSDSAQRLLRSGILEEALERSGLDTGAIPEPEMKHGSPYGYRNRFRFIGTAEGPGLMKAESDEPVALPSCPIAVQAIKDFIEPRRDGGSGTSLIEAGKKRTVYGGAEGVFLEGRDTIARERVLGRTLSFKTEGFFQSNAEMLGIMAGDLSAWMPSGRIADLYGGCGTFSAFLADKAERVTLVESDSGAASMARGNAGPGACLDVAAMHVEEWIKLPRGRKGYDAVLVDPPRGGLSPSVRSWLNASGTPELAYVSCDSITFARDLASLMEGGYRVEYFSAYDFYPQTARLESLALLRRHA